MAQSTGSYSPVKLGQDTFGGHFYGARDYKGSTSYVQGGDTVDPHAFGFPNAIETLIGSMDQTNKFQAVGRPIQNSSTPWQVVWIALVTATLGGQAQTAGQEAVAGTNLSGFTVRLSAIGY